MKKRNDYRTDLKSMSRDQLIAWIDRRIEMMIAVGEDGSKTPLLNRVCYAKKLLKDKFNLPFE